MLRKIDKQIAHIDSTREEILALLNSLNATPARYIGKESNTLKNSDSLPERFLQTLKAATLKEFRVAAIMDRFTLECFGPECDLKELTPAHWREELDSFKPEMLFIESAWEGKDSLWHGKINHCAPELVSLADECHRRNIPVIFWNKEDPIYTDTFMAAARQADVVFTTDLDCVKKYKTDLGHDYVYHLHFAAQPQTHNPLEKYQRKDRFCFAGAYYHRYVERCKVFDAFADYFINSRGFDIYDRNYKNARPEHKFPERYDPYILGSLDPSQIDIAYKGYLFGINMNSVNQSQTMFARRVFELMASNTIVVGNYSRGVKNYFGDLTICTDDAKTLETAINLYCSDEEKADKFRLLALRKVLREHLCEDRLDYIVKTVFGKSLKKVLPVINVYSRVSSQIEAEKVKAIFYAQTYENKRLTLIGDVAFVDADLHITCVTEDEFIKESFSGETEAFATYFDSNDWYGPNYLLDLALSLRYGNFDAIGKSVFYSAKNGCPVQQCGNESYRVVQEIPLRRCIVKEKLLLSGPKELISANLIIRDCKVFSADAFNYCENWSDGVCAAAGDLYLPDQGIELSEIEKIAEEICGAEGNLSTYIVDAARIAATKISGEYPITIKLEASHAVIESMLPEGKHEYIFFNDFIDIAMLEKEGKMSILFLGEGELDLVCGCVFYDGNGNKLEPKYTHLGRREVVDVPNGATKLKLIVRPKGPGSASLHRVILGETNANEKDATQILTHSKVLVLTNHYPSPDDLYRNMFVHKRVLAYKKLGKVVDVMRMNPFAKSVAREFEGINVIEGQGDTLSRILLTGKIDTVCVHFLDWDMWSVLKPFLNSIKLIIWSHGADIQPWWRREFNYHSAEELLAAKKDSEKRMKLWEEVFDSTLNSQNRITTVFVSKYAKDICEEDYKRSISGFSQIIPNFIDGNMFSYVKKNVEDRFRVISIRPYTSAIYANDIAVAAVCKLAKKTFFKDLHFTIIGRGPLFEKTVAPLKKFSNVTIKETFLRQSDVANLYHENGIILIPTRGDTQGVSRGEAMSCGLVPITNAVAAIPEFLDASCGILAPAEDVQAIADGIEYLYKNPEEFLLLSENAAKHVRNQLGESETIDKEMQLIFE